MDKISVLFDGPPSHESGRFVEVEDSSGASIRIGDWMERADGLWALVIDDPRELSVLRARVAELEACHDQ